jgi:hypothetical protein
MCPEALQGYLTPITPAPISWELHCVQSLRFKLADAKEKSQTAEIRSLGFPVWMMNLIIP